MTMMMAMVTIIIIIIMDNIFKRWPGLNFTVFCILFMKSLKSTYLNFKIASLLGITFNFFV